MRISVESLSRLAYNGLLYVKKNDLIQWSIRGGRQCEELLTVTTQDGYVALTDSAPSDGDVPSGYLPLMPFFLLQQDVKALLKWLDEVDGPTVEMALPDAAVNSSSRHLTLVSTADPTDVVGYPARPADYKLWQAYSDLLARDCFEPRPLTTWAVNPDRLRKLSLVKPGDFPIDLLSGWDGAQQREVVHFRTGPTVRGVIAPLDREVLKETYKNGELWT